MPEALKWIRIICRGGVGKYSDMPLAAVIKTFRADYRVSTVHAEIQGEVDQAATDIEKADWSNECEQNRTIQKLLVDVEDHQRQNNVIMADREALKSDYEALKSDRSDSAMNCNKFVRTTLRSFKQWILPH